MVLQPYGTTIALAILVGAYVVSVEEKRMAPLRQGYGGQVWDALPWVLVLGLVGARVYHVLHFWEFYRQNLEQVLFLWNGGLGIYGGILGGVFGLWAWARQKPAAFRRVKELLDVAAPGIAIGQAIGRFANFFSQELYGFPTKMPWGIYIKPENRFPGLESFEYFHPLFLYEALWCLLGFVILTGGPGARSYGRKNGRHKMPQLQTGGRIFGLLTGERFLCYLSFYALGRFFLEGMRIESWMVGGVRVAQAVSVGIVCGSVGSGVIRRIRKTRKTQ